MGAIYEHEVVITRGGTDTEMLRAAIRSHARDCRVVRDLLPEHFHSTDIRLLIITEDGKTPEEVALNRVKIQNHLYMLHAKILIVTTSPDSFADMVKANSKISVMKSPTNYWEAQRAIGNLLR